MVLSTIKSKIFLYYTTFFAIFSTLFVEKGYFSILARNYDNEVLGFNLIFLKVLVGGIEKCLEKFGKDLICHFTHKVNIVVVKRVIVFSHHFLKEKVASGALRVISVVFDCRAIKSGGK